MSQEASAAAANLWRSQFSQLSNKQRMVLLGALAISSVLLLIMYTSRTTTTTTRKQHSSSSACRSKAHAAYKQCKKKKKDEEETFFFGLLRTSKSGAIYIRGIHDAIDDEERDEADESDDEQEDCEADEEEEDDAAPSPEEEEEEKSNPDLDAASTFFFTPVEGESDDDDDARNALECESARTSFCLPSGVDIFEHGRHDDTDEEEEEEKDGIFRNSYLSFPQAQEESSKTGRKAAEMIANGGSSSSLNDASTSDSTTELGLNFFPSFRQYWKLACLFVCLFGFLFGHE
jgi:hypothetical protein